MENVRKHLDVHLVQCRKQLHKLTKKPTFARCRIFDQDLVAVEMKRAKVKLYKPSYSGMCILDISKYAMYDFYYNYLKTKYGANLQLMMTDTDSLLFSVQCNDIYNEMSENMELFDTSDYPETHFLHSVENKKVLGKMKDETNGVPIREFVRLRSKMYSFVFGKEEKKKLKGISKGVVKKNIRFVMHKQTIESERNSVSIMNLIRCHYHKMYCEQLNEVSLSPFDDKRYLLDTTTGLPYGHYKINQGLL